MRKRTRTFDAKAAHVARTSSAAVFSDELVFVEVACAPVFGGVMPLYTQTVYARRSGTFMSELPREIIAGSNDNPP